MTDHSVPARNRPDDEALSALVALLRDGQLWRDGRLVSSSCPSQADLCAALGWPPPWDAAWAPTEASEDKCMPHQRHACGHCPHEVCQDCDRCCSCQCGQAPVPSP